MSGTLIGLLLDKDALLSQDEVCGSARLSKEELDILTALGLAVSVRDAMYPATCLRQVQRAARLKRGLDTEWETAALVMDLLSEIEDLKNQIHRLQAQCPGSTRAQEADPH